MSLLATVRQLERLRTRFGPAAAQRKARALRRAARLRLSGPRAVAAYHDALLFLAAYPDDREIARLARRGLLRIASHLRDARRNGREAAVRAFDGTGIAHATQHVAVSLDAARWLAARFPRDVEPSWRDESLGDEMDESLRVLLPAVERDGLMVSDVSTREWLRLARGRGRGSDLAWILAMFDSSATNGPLLDRAFEAAGLSLSWRLDDPIASLTLNRFPTLSSCHHPKPPRRHARLIDELRRPRPDVRRLPINEARRLIDVARAALCVRERETDPVTYASPREVLLARLGRGLDVAVFGMRPDRRLPLESYFGFVAAKNRIPVAYGGGWVFLDRCEIGVNVFEAFRGGESARIFSDVVRVYDALFAPRLFTVSSYQIGDGNEDGIRSGAYWFYDRFGFRPLQPALERLAARERQKIAEDRRYRCPARTLRKLARSRLALTTDARADDRPPAPDAPDVGLRVTAWIGRRFQGDHVRARRVAAARVRRALDADGAGWTESERQAFDDLALLVALVPRLARWPRSDKEALVRAMRAKGGPRELPYATGLRRHERLARALALIAATPVEAIGR